MIEKYNDFDEMTLQDTQIWWVTVHTGMAVLAIVGSGLALALLPVLLGRV